MGPLLLQCLESPPWAQALHVAHLANSLPSAAQPGLLRLESLPGLASTRSPWCRVQPGLGTWALKPDPWLWLPPSGPAELPRCPSALPKEDT